MNVDSILHYKADPNEDYYGLLGCDSSSSVEQINAEFKIRAKDCHPDKNNSNPESQMKFQHLLRAKEALTDPEERSLYDAWKSAGIAMSYAQWKGLKASVKSSMHWATPKTAGRMLVKVPSAENEPISLNPSPIREKDLLEHELAKDVEQDDVEYDPIPYEKIGYRIKTPPPNLWHDDDEDDEQKENINVKKTATNKTNNSSITDANTAMRRKQFAVRRQSTIGAMVMAEKWDDNEIRRRFRNYEI